ISGGYRNRHGFAEQGDGYKSEGGELDDHVSPTSKVRWPYMDSRSAIGLHDAHVYVKSGGEAQADAPVLNPRPMTTLSSFHEWKMERGREKVILSSS
ncbi:MAG: hypothetical protein AB7F94_09320, partial [Nitrospira sp.]